MRRVPKIVGGRLGTSVLLTAYPAWRLYDEIRKARSEDPHVG
jgi:hypothetical protein